MPATAARWIPPRSAARWRCKRKRIVPRRPVLGDGCGPKRRARLHRLSRPTGPGARSNSTCSSQDGVTRRGVLHESGSLRVRFPSPEDDGLSGVFVNTAGGIAGGDRFDIDIAAGEGARLTLTTAAAEKVYRAPGPAAALNIALKAEAGAHLAWLPQETILFDRARISRRIDIDLADDASLLLCEIVVFGRAAMGETDAAWRVHRPLAAAPWWPAGVCRDHPARRRYRRKTVATGDRQRRRRHRHRADRARRRGRGGADPRSCRKRSAARSESPPGMDLQWRASVPKMRRGSAPT